MKICYFKLSPIYIIIHRALRTLSVIVSVVDSHVADYTPYLYQYLRRNKLYKSVKTQTFIDTSLH